MKQSCERDLLQLALLESLKLMPVLVLVPEELDWCRVLPFKVHGGKVQLEPGSGCSEYLDHYGTGSIPWPHARRPLQSPGWPNILVSIDAI